MSYREDFEKETGEKATYRMHSSDYHTLKYVEYLENRLKDAEEKIQQLIVYAKTL